MPTQRAAARGPSGIAFAPRGRRIRLIGLITDPGPIRKILTHLGEPLEPPPVSPARGLPIDRGELVQAHEDRDVFQVSPDEFAPEPDRPVPWRGFEASVERLRPMRDLLRAATGSAVSFSWFVRADSQVGRIYGSAGWAFAQRVIVCRPETAVGTLASGEMAPATPSPRRVATRFSGQPRFAD